MHCVPTFPIIQLAIGMHAMKARKNNAPSIFLLSMSLGSRSYTTSEQREMPCIAIIGLALIEELAHRSRASSAVVECRLSVRILPCHPDITTPTTRQGEVTGTELGRTISFLGALTTSYGLLLPSWALRSKWQGGDHNEPWRPPLPRGVRVR